MAVLPDSPRSAVFCRGVLDGLVGRRLQDHATAGRVGRRVGLEDGVDPAAAQPRQQASHELLVEPADQLGARRASCWKGQLRNRSWSWVGARTGA